MRRLLPSSWSGRKQSGRDEDDRDDALASSLGSASALAPLLDWCRQELGIDEPGYISRFVGALRSWGQKDAALVALARKILSILFAGVHPPAALAHVQIAREDWLAQQLAYWTLIVRQLRYDRAGQPPWTAERIADLFTLLARPPERLYGPQIKELFVCFGLLPGVDRNAAPVSADEIATVIERLLSGLAPLELYGVLKALLRPPLALSPGAALRLLDELVPADGPWLRPDDLPSVVEALARAGDVASERELLELFVAMRAAELPRQAVIDVLTKPDEPLWRNQALAFMLSAGFDVAFPILQHDGAPAVARALACCPGVGEVARLVRFLDAIRHLRPSAAVEPQVAIRLLGLLPRLTGDNHTYVGRLGLFANYAATAFDDWFTDNPWGELLGLVDAAFDNRDHVQRHPPRLQAATMALPVQPPGHRAPSFHLLMSSNDLVRFLRQGTLGLAWGPREPFSPSVVLWRTATLDDLLLWINDPRRGHARFAPPGGIVAYLGELPDVASDVARNSRVTFHAAGVLEFVLEATGVAGDVRLAEFRPSTWLNQLWDLVVVPQALIMALEYVFTDARS